MLNDDDADIDIYEGPRHPDGRWIIKGTSVWIDGKAWVCDALTGEICWQPADVTLMTWLRGGTEIGLIGETFTPDPAKPAIFDGVLQSEMAYWFERWSWPERQRLSHCAISMRTGWPTEVLPTPDPDIVFFEWCDQGEQGYEGIALDDEYGDAQILAESYEIGQPLMEDLPSKLFSRDTRYLIRCHSARIKTHVLAEWSQEIVVAYLTVIDRLQGTVCDIPMLKQLPQAWSPTAVSTPWYRDQGQDDRLTEQRARYWAHSSQMQDLDQVVVMFVDGTQAIVPLANATLASIPSLTPHPNYRHTMPERTDPATKVAIAAYHQQRKRPTRHLSHPHELVAIVEAERIPTYTVQRQEWICGADGDILWERQDTLMMVWLADGEQVGVVRGHYPTRTSKPQDLAFERWSWPERKLLSHLPMPDWSDKPQAMFVSPTGNTISIIMGENAGWLYRIAIAPNGGEDRVVATVPFPYRSSVVGETSDDSRLIALDDERVGWPTHAAMFRHARRFLAGTLTIYDYRAQSIRTIPLLADFAANWVPPDLDQRRSPLLPWYLSTGISLVEAARLIDDATVFIRFATKEERTIDLDH